MVGMRVDYFNKNIGVANIDSKIGNNLTQLRKTLELIDNICNDIEGNRNSNQSDISNNIKMKSEVQILLDNLINKVKEFKSKAVEV
jgi:hypothetical protein